MYSSHYQKWNWIHNLASKQSNGIFMDFVEVYVEYNCVEDRITTLLKFILTFDINVWHTYFLNF